MRNNKPSKWLINRYLLLEVKKLNKFKTLGLNNETLRAIEDLGFKEPFPIQEKAIPLILKGKDIIAQAHTGTGKTAAFSLPILNMMNGNKQTEALILTPTRELALQVTAEIRKFSKYMNIKTITIYGGQDIRIQIDALKDGTDIIVATPGRLIDHIRRNNISLKHVRFVVIDEADKMFEMGFIDDVRFILNNVDDAQTLLFSATIPDEIYDLAMQYMHEPENVLIDAELSIDKITQYYLLIDSKEKFAHLCSYIKSKNSQTIVFCSTKDRARTISKALKDNGFNTASIHGDLPQSKRDNIMNGFRKGYYDILVATDLASRGIDVPTIEYVINYDVPNDPLTYFHRIGRTARAGKNGEALTFVTKYDNDAFDRILMKTNANIVRLNERLEKIQEIDSDSKPNKRQTYRRNYYGLKSRW